MPESTAGLSLREAFEQASDELSLSEEGLEADTSSPVLEEPEQVEQPVVETSSEEGLFDELDEDNGQEEQPPGDSYEVTVDGETLKVELDELRNGYMRQADYTRKTQELQELRRETDKAIALKDMLEARPTETLRKLYQRINSGQDLDLTGEAPRPGEKDTQATGSDDIEAMVEARVQEVLENDPRLQAFQQDRAMAQIEKIFGTIEDDYDVTLSQADKQKVLERAQELETTDLETVFGSMYAKRLKAQRKRDLEKQNLKQVKPLRGEGRVDSYNPQAEKQPKKKYDSFRSALEEEIALSEQEGYPSAL